MKKIFSIISVLILSGCGIGNANFNCSEGSEDGICASASTIYQATNGELKENETLTYFKEGEVLQTTLTELQKKRAKKATNKKKVQSVSKDNLIANNFYFDKNAVRTSPRIMRIWIAPWISKEDTLSMSKFIFTDMEAKQWKFGKKVDRKNYILSH